MDFGLISKSFRFAFHALLKHWRVFVFLAVIISVLLFLLARIQSYSIITADYAISAIILMLINIMITQGVIKIALQLYDTNKASINDLFDIRFVTRFIPFAILSLFTSIGLIRMIAVKYGPVLPFSTALLLVVFLALYTRLQFSRFAFIDQNLSLSDSIKKSWYITQPFWAESLVFALIMISLNVLINWLIGATELKFNTVTNTQLQLLLLQFTFISFFFALSFAAFYKQLLAKQNVR